MYFDSSPAEEEQTPEEALRDRQWRPTYEQLITRCEHGQRVLDCAVCSPTR